MMKRMVTAFVVAAAVFAARAEATIFQFDVTGDAALNFQLDVNGPPDLFDQDGFVYRSRPFNAGVASYFFFNSPFGGGLEISDEKVILAGGDPFFSALGPQLYSGTEAAPTLTPGRFDLTGDGGTGDGGAKYALTITAIPEPQQWSLLIVGFAGLGVVVRRRERTRGATTQPSLSKI